MPSLQKTFTNGRLNVVLPTARKAAAAETAIAMGLDLTAFTDEALREKIARERKKMVRQGKEVVWRH